MSFADCSAQEPGWLCRTLTLLYVKGIHGMTPLETVFKLPQSLAPSCSAQEAGQCQAAAAALNGFMACVSHANMPAS